ncbi:MAG: RNA-binding transcriptional accessory protein [Eubacteriales bacterium]|nr:RNA-binding transcriptional accessory protein [Eubacteriales bacterium]
MDKICKQLMEEFSLESYQVENTVALIDDGNTIPFIARYRKEKTGSLSDDVLRELFTRLNALRALDEKRADILRLIDEQGKLDDNLREQIENAKTQTELEDIYRPYRPKRRTRATIAKEKGLEPLAMAIIAQNPADDIDALAAEYIDAEKEVNTAEEAVAGAMDIIAEMISDNADARRIIRELTLHNGTMVTAAAKDEDSVYSNYYEYQEPLSKIANHRILAINRGEKDEFLSVKIKIEEELCVGYLKRKTVKKTPTKAGEYVALACEDSYKRLIAPSIETEIRNFLTERAGGEAIKVFAKNLSGLLLQPPVRGRTVLGLDPGYRTGCKVAVVDDTGKVCDTGIVYCTLPNHDREKAKDILKKLIIKHNVDLISIGNGTASKETEKVAAELISELDRKVYYMVVSEAGASVYSASKLAAEEFPEFDVSLRSAVSIARRIQDPLAELVKIDPKAIGVGQYQHDMNQKLLGEALGGVVEDCVNSVGVDLNTASPSLLSYVSGINSAVAKNIATYREENGKFTSRKELLKVPKLGQKAFLQCAGFLRIVDGKELLDNTSVHPESYKAAEGLLEKLGYTEDDLREGKITDINNKIKGEKEKLAEELGVGVPTLIDIAEALLKRGRDPRDELPEPVMKSEIMDISELKPDMIMTGTVRNVIDFGAFVDIGVHQDGLVHISQISDRYIKHPLDVLSVGEVVKVKILDVDVKKKRISLTMKGI